MITDFFITTWTGMVGWVTGLLPAFDQSTTNIGLMGILQPVAVGATGLGAWIPWGVLAIEAPIVIGMYVGSLVLRAIKSLIPTISG